MVVYTIINQILVFLTVTWAGVEIFLLRIILFSQTLLTLTIKFLPYYYPLLIFLYVFRPNVRNVKITFISLTVGTFIEVSAILFIVFAIMSVMWLACGYDDLKTYGDVDHIIKECFELMKAALK